MNQMKTRLQSLGLLDRALRAATDDEIAALVATLDDDHREAVERLAGGDASPTEIRGAATKGRLDGTMESLAMVLSDAALADGIEQLGDHSDNPTSEQLRAVLPGLIERHGLAATRLMLASTVAGEANAAAVIRDLLKHDDTVKLPPVERTAPEPTTHAPKAPDAEREALLTRRAEQKARKQEQARLRREQSARDRGRA